MRTNGCGTAKERMKAGKDHVIPLSDAMVALLKSPAQPRQGLSVHRIRRAGAK